MALLLVRGTPLSLTWAPMWVMMFLFSTTFFSPFLRDTVKGIGHVRVSGVAEPFQRGVYSRESSSDCLNLSDGVTRLCFKLTCAYMEQSSICCSMRSPPPKKKTLGLNELWLCMYILGGASFFSDASYLQAGNVYLCRYHLGRPPPSELAESRVQNWFSFFSFSQESKFMCSCQYVFLRSWGSHAALWCCIQKMTFSNFTFTKIDISLRQ